ncbi:phosphotransferase [Kribbella sp. NBC_00709]|uniref:phosphotransferase enzyme family protein n=1 Tax=Kribbella sp. NBC_00709 TaxID=2975972 RepID=UPI002E2D5716|nr:phosphotransferase [Kribbella sp. NBC_00709]
MDVAEVLRERWGLTASEVEALDGGMGSFTWLAAGEDWRVVVKTVDGRDNGFAPGLELAERLSDGGVTTGRPVRSSAGRIAERVDGRVVGVLEFVDGTPLGSAEADQRTIGGLLGRVHELSAMEPGDLKVWLGVVTQWDDYLDLEPWIRPACAAAVSDALALEDLSWAGLHGDPAAEAFLRRPSGDVALIDWGAAMYGPILYDVASAAMYNGRTHIVSSYLAGRPDRTDEVRRGLDAFLRVRYAVQAAYFAWRCTEDVRVGITSPAENHKGLSDARRSFGL